MRVVSGNRMKASVRRALCALMVLYGTATTFVPLADALLEAEAGAFAVHVENDGPPCSSLHDPLTCALCQFIGLASSTPSVVFMLDLPNPPPLFERIREQLLHVPDRFSPLGPRGPPIA